MRRKRVLLILVLALVSGTLAMYAALQLLAQRSTPLLAADSGPPAAPVVIAAKDLPLGSMVSEEDVRLVDWPGGAVPAGYAQSISDVVGRGLLVSVGANEPLLESKLADRSGGAGLPIIIPEGMRAISVRVDEVIAVAGFVTPGTRVDVLLTTEAPGGGGQITKVVLQNVQALAANQQITRDEEGRPMPVGVLTVLLTPEDAERLVLASGQGRIQLALRNMLDMREIRTVGARMGPLLANAGVGGGGGGGTRRAAAAPTAEAEPAQPNTIEVIKGGNRALIKF